MRIPMAAAVLAGGGSRRMGVPKASLPYGRTTLLAHQTERLSRIFDEVLVVAKEAPGFDAGPSRLVLDRTADQAPIHGLARALEEVSDRLFVLAVDLPALTEEVIRAVAGRSLASPAPAVVPHADGKLQPLAAVWRRSVLPAALARIARGELSLHGLAQEVGAEVLAEEEWRAADPSGNSFANLNTIEQYNAVRERA
jgi:molybdopterin-guanine dinucleotide biosynthesis protein A